MSVSLSRTDIVSKQLNASSESPLILFCYTVGLSKMNTRNALTRERTDHFAAAVTRLISRCQRSFRLKVLIWTHIHRTDCATRTAKSRQNPQKLPTLVCLQNAILDSTIIRPNRFTGRFASQYGRYSFLAVSSHTVAGERLSDR